MGDSEEIVPDTFTLETDQYVSHRLTGFAVLTVDWNERHRSYLDNFIEFVLSSMMFSSAIALSSQQIVSALFDNYRIRLPERVVSQILNRAVKLDFLEKNTEDLYRTSVKGQKLVLAVKPRLEELVREQSELIQSFVKWADDQHQVSLSHDEANEALVNYVDTYYGTLMSSAIGSGSIGSHPPLEPTPLQRISASFVKWVAENDSQNFNFLLNVAKGSMLAAALFTPKLVQLDHHFNDTTILLDTRILFRATGYEGVEARAATLEYINLLVVQGAKVGAFDFTLQEAKSVLAYVRQMHKVGKLWESRPGTVGAFYFRSNASLGQIDLDIAQFENHLRALNISIVMNPSYDERYVVDEQAIEGTILSKMRHHNEGAVRHDVKALAAIVRLRHGRARDSFEDCSAVFVTLNSALLAAAHGVQDLREEPWFVAMHDTDVATLAWIKSPPSAPDLPKHILLTTCLGVLRPSDATWQSYVHELEAMYSSSLISDEDLLMLRQAYEKDNMAIVPNSIHGGNGIKTKIVASLEKVELSRREEIETPLKKDLSAAANREALLLKDIDELRRTTSEYMADKARRESKIRRDCRRRGRLLQISATTLLCAVLLLTSLSPQLTLYSRYWDLSGKIVLCIALIFGGFSAPGKWLGSKLEKWMLDREGIQAFEIVIENV